MTQNNGDLIDACRAGDPVAQHCLYEQYRVSVHQTAVRLLGRANAADTTQEVFLRVFRGLAKFRSDADVGTWIFRIAINECLRQRRRQRNAAEPLDAELEVECPRPNPAHALEQAEFVERALEQLEPALRDVFLWRECKGLSYEEIAKLSGLPVGTVGSQLNRARSQLRAYLGRCQGES